MINSIIASGHHYYVLFFDSSQIRTVDLIPSFFDLNSDVEVISGSKNRSDAIFHMQIEMDTLFGSEALLIQNKSKRKTKKPFFWYDLYFGTADADRKIYFLCYPYSKLGKFINLQFTQNGIHRNFYKPRVHDVLEFMRSRTKLSKTESNGLSVDITKYTAEILEEANAKKVNLIGANPLNSHIYEILIGADIQIDTIALRLHCQKTDLGGVELSFDRLGNYRFFIRKFTELTTLPLLPLVFNFFDEIKTLEKSQFISGYTLLEDEQ